MSDGTSEDPRVVDSRRRIRLAVLELVEERGLRGTKIKDVLERAAVARATFYAHFDDKEAAFLGDFDLLRIPLPPGGPADGPPPTPPLGPVFEHIEDMRPVLQSILKHGETELPLAVARRDLLATYRKAARELLERGFPLAGPPDALAEAATGAVLALVLAWATDGGLGDPAQAAELTEDLVRRMFS